MDAFSGCTQICLLAVVKNKANSNCACQYHIRGYHMSIMQTLCGKQSGCQTDWNQHQLAITYSHGS